MNDTRLENVRSEIAACRICRDRPERQPPLPHEPRPVCVVSSTARIVLCGQAPGTRVHASGRPFTDPSGDRLRAWLDVDDERFYDANRIAIVPMGFCFPGLDAKGGDLPPRPECARAWHVKLFAVMPQIELVVAIGAYAQAFHLGQAAKKRSLTETVADWRAVMDDPSRAYRVIPTPHPSWRNTAWLKRNPWFEAELLPVLRTHVHRLL